MSADESLKWRSRADVVHKPPEPSARDICCDVRGVSVGVRNLIVGISCKSDLKRREEIFLQPPAYVVEKFRKPSSVVEKVILLEMLPEIFECEWHLLWRNGVPGLSKSLGNARRDSAEARKIVL